MLEVWLTRGNDGSLGPSTSFDAALLDKLPRGQTIIARLFRKRNLQHHRKFFAALQAAFESQERFTNYERFRAYVIVQAGFGKSWECPPHWVSKQALAGLVVIAPYVFAEPLKSGMIRLSAPRSVRFDEMDQSDFEQLYDRAMDVLLQEFGFDVAAWENMYGN